MTKTKINRIRKGSSLVAKRETSNLESGVQFPSPLHKNISTNVKNNEQKIKNKNQMRLCNKYNQH